MAWWNAASNIYNIAKKEVSSLSKSKNVADAFKNLYKDVKKGVSTPGGALGAYSYASKAGAAVKTAAKYSSPATYAVSKVIPKAFSNSSTRAAEEKSKAEAKKKAEKKAEEKRKEAEKKAVQARKTSISSIMQTPSAQSTPTAQPAPSSSSTGTPQPYSLPTADLGNLSPEQRASADQNKYWTQLGLDPTLSEEMGVSQSDHINDSYSDYSGKVDRERLNTDEGYKNKVSSDLDAFQQLIAGEINKERVAQGLPEQSYDQIISEALSAVRGEQATSPEGAASNYMSQALSDSATNEVNYANIMGTSKEAADSSLANNAKLAKDRYAFLTGDIKSRLPIAEKEKTAALSGVDSEMQNLTTKAGIGKENVLAQYADTEENLKEEKAKLDQDLARIFEGRNVVDSSYFIKEKQKSNDKFLGTLEKLGGEKSRQLAAYDADITYYQKQAVDKRAEIEAAYAKTVQQINSDLTKTQFEQEDALAKLESEYNTKISTIDNNIMEFSLKQQEFRQGVSQWYAEHSADFSAAAAKQTEEAAMKSNPVIKQYMDMGFTLAQAQQLAGKAISQTDAKKTQNQIDTEIRQDLISSEAQDMSEEEKIQYIVSKGGKPEDFGYYPSY
jgi:hypothetical protein